MPSLIEKFLTRACWTQGGYLEPYTSQWITCGLDEETRRFLIKAWAITILVGITLQRIRASYTRYITRTTSKVHNNGPLRMKQQQRRALHTISDIKAAGRDDDGRPMYLVSHGGDYSDQDTWEYASDLDIETLREFRRKNGERRRSSSRRRSSGTRGAAPLRVYG